MSTHKHSESALNHNHDKFWTLCIVSSCKKKIMFQGLNLSLPSGGTGKERTHCGGPIKIANLIPGVIG